MSTTMGAPALVRELVERFERFRDQYHAGAYKEAQLRQDFLNRLFEALGWDIDNRAGQPEPFKDVVLEPSVTIEGRKKAPDYAFRIGGRTKFYVEAKKPSVNVAESAASSYQLRRYAWSTGHSLGILSDFEEFAVYDCRYEPKPSDSAATARIVLLSYTDYEPAWNDIAALFSHEAVARGSLDAYSAREEARGTRRVDARFLSDIEKWREALAKDLAKRNPSITARELNGAVQLTIDRIIFLRISEDRGVEQYGRLQEALKGSDIYSALCRLYYEADHRYNSGLFYFRQEQGRSTPPDRFTTSLNIGDGVLTRIIRELYFPKSPYEFSVFPADVLGSVYERFLGKVVTLKQGGRIEIKEKPEVRKAGGVYYTPEGIVGFIVGEVLSRLLKNKRPGSRGGASRLRILDPACGSGSFLVRSYEYLLDWHLDAYLRDGPDNHSDVLAQDAVLGFRLKTSERRRILLNNIYGVDIDPQAVEVTKLSLLLKVLEGETAEVIEQQLAFFKERALPDLDDNIKCGNSLIAPDYYQTQFDLTEADHYRTNAFDWRAEFPDIIQSGGFDGVLGNPPYIDSEWMTRFHADWRRYLSTHYAAASGNWDIFCVFLEKALELCREGGYASFIVPNKLGSAEYAAEARRVLTEQNRLLTIRDYSDVPVFPVAVYPIVYVARRGQANTQAVLYEKMRVSPERLVEISERRQLDYQQSFGAPRRPWAIFSGSGGSELLERLEQLPRLDEVANVSGAATVAEAYEIAELLDESEGNEEDLLVINSGTIDRYEALWGRKPTRYIGTSFKRPVVRKSNQRRLPPQRLVQARSEKIIVAGMTKRLECVGDFRRNILAGKSTTIVLPRIDGQYLLAILNSGLINYYYNKTYGGNRLQGGYLRIGPPQVKTIPIKIPETADEIRTQQAIVALVDRIDAVAQQLSRVRTIQDERVLRRNFHAIDQEVEHAIYEIYGLSDAEIAMVEASP